MANADRPDDVHTSRQPINEGASDQEIWEERTVIETKEVTNEHPHTVHHAAPVETHEPSMSRRRQRSRERAERWRNKELETEPSQPVPTECPPRRRTLWIGAAVGVALGLLLMFLLFTQTTVFRPVLGWFYRPQETVSVAAGSVENEQYILGFSNGALAMARLRPKYKWLGRPAGRSQEHRAAIVSLAVGRTVDNTCALLVSADATGRVLVRNYNRWTDPEWNAWELLSRSGAPRYVSFVSQGIVAVRSDSTVTLYVLSVRRDPTLGYVLYDNRLFEPVVVTPEWN